MDNKEITMTEKEAIKNLKEIINLSKNDENVSAILDLYDLKSLDIVLNLITRLKKENEEYKILYEKALGDVVSANKENVELKKQIGEKWMKKFFG